MPSARSREFKTLEPDRSWSFAWLTPRETGYVTHGYHRYPAKFIPQVARRLIEEHSGPGDVVVDPFMGSGTTLVEALMAGRRARGLDINPAAVIASRAKTTPLPPGRLRAAVVDFEEKLRWLEDEHLGRPLFLALPEPLLPEDQERLDWWFPKANQRRLGVILALLEEATDTGVRDFLRCAFSHCLKTASFWLMKSSKPTRDKAKLARGAPSPARPLRRHLAKMERGNAELWRALPDASKRRSRSVRDVRCGDARQLPWPPDSAHLVVTSPPYVTSYEYAGLHELTNLWLAGRADLAAPREVFIGSAAARNRSDSEGNSPLARKIVAKLRESSPAKADEARQYFLDMEDAFREMHRILRPGGKVCNVIGNTSLAGVEILNAEVHAELLEALGFEVEDVVCRVIPLKTLPQVRDPKTGKFTSARTGTVEAYPEEFILIARKG